MLFNLRIYRLLHVCCVHLMVIGNILFQFACTDNKRLEYALEFAEENRGELEKVLEHYKNDNLKYEAARFLIENMPRYYAYKGGELDSVRRTLAKYRKQLWLSSEELEYWENFAYEREEKVYDAKVITADYLIANIDHAFELWKKRPWNRDLSFDDFCELLLPYRVMNEPLEEWRQPYERKYGYLLDSLYTGSDVIEATNVVVRHLSKEGFANFWRLRYPHLGPSFLMEYRVGTCFDACDLGIYVLRALGIPVAIDQYIYSSETRKAHAWNVVRDTTGRYAGFWTTEGVASRDSNYSDLRKAGKIYRQCFGARVKELKEIRKDKQVPSTFKFPYRKDVSVDYFPDTVRISASKKEYGKYAFLGVFHPRHWVEMDMAEIKNGEAIFPHVEANVVYVPMSYKNEKLEVMDYPFLFDGKCNIPYKPDLNNRETVKLLRKNPLFEWTRSSFLDMVLGAIIELSNTEDFRKVRYRYRVTDTLCLAYNWINLPDPVRCRYARYQAAPDKYVRLAEFQCWTSEGRQIPISVGGSKAWASWGYENTQDDDPLTHCGTPQAGDQLVVDYGKEIAVEKILYVPQNDDNFIRMGDEYELFYHGGKEGWVSLGRKRATGLWLIYDNMPKGALFHLRCLTRGIEEQVFHIENGVQIFVSNLAKPLALDIDK